MMVPSQGIDPGSIPGRRTLFFKLFFFKENDLLLIAHALPLRVCFLFSLLPELPTIYVLVPHPHLLIHLRLFNQP